VVPNLPICRFSAILLAAEGLAVDRQTQIDFILDHYENPRHCGALADADAVAQEVNPGCGDVVTIYLKADAAGCIQAISFEGDGCTISLAAASIVTEMFADKTLTDVEAASPDAILNLIGREIAATRLKCVALGLNALKEAARRLRNADSVPRLFGHGRLGFRISQ
jgi:nitrogen fixation NifU-like protein